MPFIILTPVARRDYRCIYCGQCIPKGEKHSKASGAWEGDFQDWRMHNECLKQHDEDSRDNQDGGLIYPGAGVRPSASASPSIADEEGKEQKEMKPVDWNDPTPAGNFGE